MLWGTVKMLAEYKYDKKLACLDNIVKYISLQEKTGYCLFFSESWQFNYRSHRKLIGKGIIVDYDNNYTALKFYHGLGARKIKRLCRISKVPVLLQQYSYVTVFVDAFYCTWNKDYQKKHSNSNLILINDFDSTNRLLYITDLKYQLFNHVISFDVYKQAALDGIAFFRCPEKRQITYKDIHFFIQQKLKTIYKHTQNLQRFRHSLLKMDIQKENDSPDNPWGSSLIQQLGRYIIDCYRYLYFLHYLNEVCSISLDKITSIFEKVIENWIMLQNNLVRQLVNRKVNGSQNCSKVDQIIEMDIEVYHCLFEILTEIVKT